MPTIPKKMAEMAPEDWQKWYARILAGGPEPECTTGSPAFIGVLLPPGESAEHTSKAR